MYAFILAQQVITLWPWALISSWAYFYGAYMNHAQLISSVSILVEMGFFSLQDLKVG